MNLTLPFQDNPHIAYASMWISVVILGIAFLLFQKKRKI
jgi:LPXTG-motif cell wall-anchored protein